MPVYVRTNPAARRARPLLRRFIDKTIELVVTNTKPTLAAFTKKYSVVKALHSVLLHIPAGLHKSPVFVALVILTPTGFIWLQNSPVTVSALRPAFSDK